MLKTLKRDDISTTPYVATKNWELSNVVNDDVVLAENGNPVASEKVNYFATYTSPTSTCAVAKEDQDADLLLYREGLKTSGLFFPELESQNLDGTYKRLVYAQVKTMFYNNYRDPTKVWGAEKIDFDTSETKKFLSDYIKVFSIPQEIMGENIVKNTVVFTDNTLDNDYSISDDGKCNLFAGPNLFSKEQILGYFENIFETGSNNTCDSYFIFDAPSIPSLTGSVINITGFEATASLSWTLPTPTPLGFYMEKAISGSSFAAFSYFPVSSLSVYDFPIITGSVYYYKINAYNSWGSSSWSNVVTLSFTGAATCTLEDSDGNEYVLGPYDTFECYTPGTDAGNSGYGWDSAWEFRPSFAPDFAIFIAHDETLYPSGSSRDFTDDGEGWSGSWYTDYSPDTSSFSAGVLGSFNFTGSLTWTMFGHQYLTTTYEVFRSSSLDSDFVYVGSTSSVSSIITYLDNGLQTSSTYIYKIRNVNSVPNYTSSFTYTASISTGLFPAVNAIYRDALAFWNLDEHSGSRTDWVGGHNLTDNNTVSHSVGKVTGSAHFTLASAEYLSVTASASPLDTLDTGDWTIQAWASASSWSQYCGVVIFNNMGIVETKLTKWGVLTAGNVSVTSRNPITNSVWTHLVARKSGSNRTLFINGTENTTSLNTDTGYGLSGVYWLGRGYSSTYYGGRLDQVAVWNRPLSQAEITQLYNGGAGL